MSHNLYFLCKSSEISYVLTCRSVNNIVYILYKAFNNSSQYYDFVNILFKHCTAKIILTQTIIKNIFNKSYLYFIIFNTTFK